MVAIHSFPHLCIKERVNKFMKIQLRSLMISLLVFICSCKFVEIVKGNGILFDISEIFIGENIKNPYSIAISKEGMVYLGDATAKTYFVYNPHTKAVVREDILQNHVEKFSSIAMNNKGEIFFGDMNKKRIYKMDRKGDIITFALNIEFPLYGMFFYHKNLYVVEGGGITFISPKGLKRSLIYDTVLLNSVQDLTFDKDGNLFVTDTEHEVLYKITPNLDIFIIESPLLRQPRGITIDSQGNLYITNTVSNKDQRSYIVIITPKNKIFQITSLMSDFMHLEQVKFNKVDGCLYVASYSSRKFGKSSSIDYLNIDDKDGENVVIKFVKSGGLNKSTLSKIPLIQTPPEDKQYLVKKFSFDLTPNGSLKNWTFREKCIKKYEYFKIRSNNDILLKGVRFTTSNLESGYIHLKHLGNNLAYGWFFSIPCV